MPEFKAPRVRAKDPLANKDGTPTNAFVRFWDTFCKTLEGVIRNITEINERQDDTDTELQEQIDRINRILRGEENFTGIQVGGQNVATFLEQTDGTKLINTAGLGTGVVITGNVFNNAITNEAAAETSATLDLTGMTPITIQQVTYTTTGGPLEVRANFYLNVWHPSGGGIDCRVRITRSTVGNIFDQTISAIGGDFIAGWQTPTVLEQPAAGTWTWSVILYLSNNDAATQSVQSRALSVREFKR